MISKQMFIAVAALFIFVDNCPWLTCDAVVHYFVQSKFFLLVHCKNVSERLTFIFWKCFFFVVFFSSLNLPANSSQEIYCLFFKTIMSSFISPVAISLLVKIVMEWRFLHSSGNRAFMHVMIFLKFSSNHWILARPRSICLAFFFFFYFLSKLLP